MEKLHCANILHNSLAADSIRIGRTMCNNKVYLQDFKKAFKLLEGTNQVRLDMLSVDQGFSENANNRINIFSSLNAKIGLLPSKKDDLESLFYILMFLYRKGKLFDKFGVDLSNPKDNSKYITEIARWKSHETPEQICKDSPECFLLYLRYIRAHDSTLPPQYAYLRSLFFRCLPSVDYSGMNQKNIMTSQIVRILALTKEIGHTITEGQTFGTLKSLRANNTYHISIGKGIEEEELESSKIDEQIEGN